MKWTPVAWELPKVEAPKGRSVGDLTPEDIDVVFQPIVDLRRGEVFGEEALVRCKWPEYRNPPALFSRATVERSCGRLGRLIREVTFERCQDDLALFVNLHPQELRSRWLTRPDDPIATNQTRPVYLEITETTAFEQFGLCHDVLKDLCERTGASVVVDDLGAGYSSLKRIVDLEPSVVKLDRALISSIDKDRRRQLLVKHMAELCTALGAQCVAEGIETFDELCAVMDAGIGLGQGYYLARPAYPSPEINWPFKKKT